jgi:spectinomycin phosphotransferase
MTCLSATLNEQKVPLGYPGYLDPSTDISEPHFINMLERPKLQTHEIAAYLDAEYGLNNAQVVFMPIGADMNTAVFRVTEQDGDVYFLKLRRGSFDKTSVVLPRFYSEHGVPSIIPPLPTQSAKLWGKLAEFKTILYPFVQGRDAYEIKLSERNWNEFGTALKALHSTTVPDEIRQGIRKETYSDEWRQAVTGFMSQLDPKSYSDPIAIKLAEFLRDKRGDILALIKRTEDLAQTLLSNPRPSIVCHSDLHAGNLLINSDGSLFIVDWDEPILAPKERDLMYIGAGLLASGHSPKEEEGLFYRHYGETTLDPVALAYYRYERIIRDIGEYCDLLLLSDEGGEDRAQSLYYLKSNFQPNGTIEIARSSDRADEMDPRNR